MRYLTASFLVIGLIPLPLQAEDHPIQHDAHTHGKAQLQMVLERGTIEIRFMSPALNIVGFEHPAHTDIQRQRIATALSALKDGTNLFTFEGADCNLKSVEAEHEIEDEHHDDHATEAESSHSEFHAQYKYKCTEKTTPKSIHVNLLRVFPAIDVVDTQWIMNDQQGAVVLKQNSIRIQF